MLAVRQSAIIRLFYLDEKWKKLIRVYLQISFLILSEFKKMFLFYSLRNHQKTYGFLVTSGGIEINSLTFAYYQKQSIEANPYPNFHREARPCFCITFWVLYSEEINLSLVSTTQKKNMQIPEFIFLKKQPCRCFCITYRVLYSEEIKLSLALTTQNENKQIPEFIFF